MPSYEYKVVPAPRRGVKAKGVKTAEDRFAHALQALMNELGAQGWEYQRSDTLPCEERSGLFRRNTVEQIVMTFRRTRASAEDRLAPRVMEGASPLIAAPRAAPAATPAATPAPGAADDVPVMPRLGPARLDPTEDRPATAPLVARN